MKWKSRFVSLLCAAFLLCSLCGAGIASAEESSSVVSVRNKDDFFTLVRNCALDSWSKGITVELETDLDFGGEDIRPIPSFSGIFHGNGHSIRGLTLSTDGSNQALFRYLTAEAEVSDLSVAGEIAPTYGRLRIGGIAGTNWGTIRNCSFSGSISGLNYVGGIVGENHGSVESCSFDGNVEGKRFSGGIAGYNEGIVTLCRNLGDINTTLSVESLDLEDLATASNGLALNLLSAEDENIISDTGGIVGFSKGIVIDCSNTGVIGYPHYGYNVGGIAGRQSGYLSACRNSGQVYGKKDVAGIVGQMEPYLDLIKSTNLADELLLLNKYLNNASGDISDLAAEFRALQDEINAEQFSYDYVDIGGGNIYHAYEEIPEDTASGSGIITPDSGSGGTISGGSGSEGSISGDGSSGTIQDITDWINGQTGGNISSEDYSSVLDSIDVNSISEALDARMQELAGRLGDVYGVIQSSGGDLAYDLSQANDQFSRVLLLMANAMNGSPQTDIFQDVSEQYGETVTEGLVSGNTNYGGVEGDNNVGGIAGAMGIEYEFDLEDSLSQIVGANGIINNTYSTNCVNSGNVNFAAVLAKKDRVGGAVGSEDSGTVRLCESYGSVTSTDGSYVGGIAGYSDTSIYSSYAFCQINGARYVGGIVGSGRSILDSVSMIETDTDGAFVGAVAGWADMEAEENVTGNLYVHDSLGAIDGISYLDRAAPISYEELITREGIPDGFREVSVSFFADGRLVRTLRVPYGGSLDRGSIPAVPPRAGYSGYWDGLDDENLRFSRDVEAVYTLNRSSISSYLTREDSPLSLVLLEGSFPDDNRVFLAPYGGEGPSLPETRTVETWELSVTGSDTENASFTVRYLPPDDLKGKDVTILRLENGSWVPVETGTSGSYITFPSDSEQIVFSAVTAEPEQKLPTKQIIVFGAAGLLLLIVIVAAVRSHRKKRRAKPSENTD